MLKKLIKPFVVPILDMNYRMKKKLYFKNKMKYILKILQNQNISEINKFNEIRWHHGYCYFTGIYKNKKVFIKIDTKLKMLKNEKTFYEVMKDKIQNYLIPIELFYENNELQIIVYEFLSNYRELDNEKLCGNLNYLDDIYIILKAMKENQIVHRDIKLNNFMVAHNEIKVIDFTFSNSLSDKSNFKELDISIRENIFILKALDVGLNSKDFHWNDSSLMIKILKSNYFEDNFENLILYIKKFKELSSNNTYVLNLELDK